MSCKNCHLAFIDRCKKEKPGNDERDCPCSSCEDYCADNCEVCKIIDHCLFSRKCHECEYNFNIYPDNEGGVEDNSVDEDVCEGSDDGCNGDCGGCEEESCIYIRDEDPYEEGTNYCTDDCEDCDEENCEHNTNKNDDSCEECEDYCEDDCDECNLYYDDCGYVKCEDCKYNDNDSGFEDDDEEEEEDTCDDEVDDGETREERASRIFEEVTNSAGIQAELVIEEDSLINGYCYGDRLSVTRGAINKLDDDELAFLMAHELSHIKGRHGPRLYVERDKAIKNVANSIDKADGVFRKIISGGLSTLSETIKFKTVSKILENEADNEAVDIIEGTNYDSDAGEKLMSRSLGGGGLLDSHPSSSSRAWNIKNRKRKK